nr:hypothetical protein BaRGS_022866 [Batillaria attramentaria]
MCYGPDGKAVATQPSFAHFTGATLGTEKKKKTTTKKKKTKKEEKKKTTKKKKKTTKKKTKKKTNENRIGALPNFMNRLKAQRTEPNTHAHVNHTHSLTHWT